MTASVSNSTGHGHEIRGGGSTQQTNQRTGRNDQQAPEARDALMNSEALEAQTQKCLKVHDQLRQLVAAKGAGVAAGTTAASHCRDGYSCGAHAVGGSQAENGAPEPGAWAEEDKQPSEGHGCHTEALIERRSQLRAELALATAAAEKLRAEIEGSKAASENFQKAVNASCTVELQRLGKMAANLEKLIRSRYEGLQNELQQRPQEQQQQQRSNASTPNASAIRPRSNISPRGLRDPPDLAPRADMGVTPLIRAPRSPQRVAATTVVMPPSPRVPSPQRPPSASSAPGGTDGRHGRQARSLPGSMPQPGTSRRAAATAATAGEAGLASTAQSSAHLRSRRAGTPSNLSSSMPSSTVGQRRVASVSLVTPKASMLHTAQHMARGVAAPSDSLAAWHGTGTPVASGFGPSSAPASPRASTNKAVPAVASRQKSSPSTSGSPARIGPVTSAASRCLQTAPLIGQQPLQTAAGTPQMQQQQQQQQQQQEMLRAGPAPVHPLGSAPGNVGAAQ